MAGRGRTFVRAWLALAFVVAGLASSHGTTIPHDLAGVELCVDDRSLTASFEGDEAGLPARLVRERIERALRATFDAAALPWRREGVCPPGRGYVEIGLHVRDAAWFAPRAAAYDVTVRVGWRHRVGDRAHADPPDAFDFAERELFDEAAVGVPAFVFLPRYVEAALRDLSVSWWEDRAEAPGGAPWWVPLAGAMLATLTATACWVVLARRRRRTSGSSATASFRT